MNPKVNIEKLCLENWDSMKISLHSRFCEHCQKDVMDFTTMDKRQILEYLLKNYNKQTCGRIKASQLDFNDTDFIITIEALGKLHKNTNLSFYLLAIGSLILASCGDKTTSQKKASMPSHLATEKNLDHNADIKVSQETSNIKEVKKDQPENIKTGSTATVTDSLFEPKDVIFVGDIVCSPSNLGGNDAEIGGNDKNHNHEPYFVVEKMPEFEGGIDSLIGFVKKNLIYPEWERKNRIQGKVYVRFVIDKTGKAKDAKIARTVETAKNFDKEVLRIVNKMPNWIPGEQGNQKVDVYFTIPIDFKLD